MPRLIGVRRHGFTMVEMLVTMAILSVVGVVVSRLMLGQQRFYQRTSEQMGMRRELRSAMSLVPADLRSVSSSGGDLTTFDASSLTFRAVLGASAVCARPSNSALDLPPLNMARTTITSWYTTPQAGDTVWAFNDSLSRGAEDDVWALTSAERRALGMRPLPASLDQAIVEMERSELVAETLGEHVFDFFLRNKRAEWDEYRRHVTGWELDRYLPIL